MNALILVSGFGGPGLEWRASPIRCQSEWYGYKSIYFKQCNMGLGDIEHNGRKLARLVNSVADLPNCEKVWVVGHSMGGLVARYAAQHQARLEGYITIGTPHKGTYKALLAPWSTSARQMQPDSQLLKNLNAGPLHPNALNIACRYDTVVPYKNSIEHNARACELVNHTHMSAILSTEVAKSVFGFIQNVDARNKA